MTELPRANKIQSKNFPPPESITSNLTVTTSAGDHLTKDIPVTVGLAIDSLQNVSARLRVRVAERVGISGFIVGGNGTK